MSAVTIASFRDRLPTPEEVDNAADAMTAIESCREKDRTLVIGDATLAAPLVDLISHLFSIIAKGDTVTLVPLARQLTTQEAADLLNVSRPHLIKLLERGELPFGMAGTHRRISLSDVLDYKAQRDIGRREALDRMRELAEELET